MKTTIPTKASLSIVSAIRNYCYQTGDYRDPADNASINDYLKQRLSDQNWAYWQRLRPDERAAFVNNQDMLPYDTSSLREFKTRIIQAKKAGYEPYKFWH
ncbi:hypothetical protein [Spirosoma pollinicola]|uniref:Uncharacterized protein n=1 Tax=Spirosoma pollinicola TaxID=2057025 RepID=A0A2K8YYK8_9BACT|nr:hypothetical protein [Spirosoma pollinicola]AUD02628.1 hypothetical protein CWM47_12760 [Spirosoma pollinicola]